MFIIMALFAFASFILLITQNSYKAEKLNRRGLHLVGGIVCGLIAITLLIIIAKNSGGGAS